MQVRPRESDDLRAVDAFLTRWNSLRVARRGALELALEHPALLAEEDERLLGVLTYVVDGTQCEVLTLHADERHRGVGSALVAEVQRIAARAGCTRLWVITTNDNLEALRFSQRRGFRLAGLDRCAVDGSRARLKPEIPNAGQPRDPSARRARTRTGHHGAPMTRPSASSRRDGVELGDRPLAAGVVA